MSNRIRRIAPLALALVTFSAAAASAQFGGGKEATRMGKIEEGGAPMRVMEAPPALVSIVLDHGKDFSLSDPQHTKLEHIHTWQDSANKPWTDKLDSLRKLRPTGDEMAKTRQMAMLFMDNMREANDDARKQVMELLNPEQQKRAGELEDEARDKMQRQMRPKPDDKKPEDNQRQDAGGGRRRP